MFKEVPKDGDVLRKDGVAQQGKDFDIVPRLATTSIVATTDRDNCLV